ncbi:hypothetical protein CC86DRAFT_124726 [Ophiobolus disseminans]|uniref:REJ domain-containing protein n=1 Tax=Ophiobolus disseminans TaxID=1469910 RepID=A0A6A6ZGE2_9PLEO|nr:hypothetical protein CC86DRAFT_124726 [Ophiobolus disseminans]
MQPRLSYTTLISVLAANVFAQQSTVQPTILPTSTPTLSSTASPSTSQDLALSSLSLRISSVSASIASVRSSSAIAPRCTGKYSWSFSSTLVTKSMAKFMSYMLILTCRCAVCSGTRWCCCAWCQSSSLNG